uniref:Sperm microtubule inner protein 4 n=1 Tax=Aquila chrysaetos chrysaetos TaxID=223781 RepID=A0A663EK02_AQUCH
MMLLHALPHYYREIEGTEILSRIFESNEVLTPLQIPSCPTISQDRYKEFTESLHCCKLPWGAEREHGGIVLPVLPEDNRAKGKSPCTFVKGHQTYGSGVDPWPRKFSFFLSFFLTTQTNPRLLCLPFPTSHPYQTHISTYAMIPNFRSHEDLDTAIDASSHQPFHSNIPTKAFDVVVLRKTRGNPYRHEVVRIPSDSQKKAVHWPGQHTYFQGRSSYGKRLPKFAEERGQICYSNPPKIVAPNSTVKELEYNLSPRTTNMLRNTERVLGITTEFGLQRDLDDSVKPVTFSIYKQNFLPIVSQVRPLEGYAACLLQGQHPHESILQEQYSSSIQIPLPLFTVPTVIASYSGTMMSKIKTVASLGQQHKVTENTDQKWDVSQEQATVSQTCYQKVHYLDTRPPIYKLQKITDTLQTEALYRRQLSGRPELEPLPKSACSLSYKDFKPRHLDQHTIWENPASLNKAGLPLDDGPRQTALPEWIPSCKVPLPSCKVPQNQTALLELQHSFCKTAAQKHFHDSIRGETKDLRGNITEGKRHKFYGFNAFYFFN